jgi:hypothetical protein
MSLVCFKKIKFKKQGRNGRVRGGGGGEMTQTLCAHMNKRKKKNSLCNSRTENKGKRLKSLFKD